MASPLEPWTCGTNNRLLSSCLLRVTSSTTNYCLKMPVGRVAWGEQNCISILLFFLDRT
jgi:hypothetical protein